MPESISFDALVNRLKARDDDAAAEVFHRYARRLIGLARSRLDARLRGKIDPEDVVQSVFNSFYLRVSEGRLDLDGWGGLWAVLVVLTVRRCGHKLRFFLQDRRDVGRESAPAAGESDAAPVWEARDSEPGPLESVQLTDTLEHLFRGLENADREVVVLRLQGYSMAEIAGDVHCTERRVSRILDLVKDRLGRLCVESEQTP